MVKHIETIRFEYIKKSCNLEVILKASDSGAPHVSVFNGDNNRKLGMVYITNKKPVVIEDIVEYRSQANKYILSKKVKNQMLDWIKQDGEKNCIWKKFGLTWLRLHKYNGKNNDIKTLKNKVKDYDRLLIKR